MDSPSHPRAQAGPSPHGQLAKAHLIGRSMEPGMPQGTEVLIRLHTAASPPIGAIVLLTASGGRHVLHRLVKLHGNMLITQGDRLPVPDAPWGREALRGIVVAVQRQGVWRRPRAGTGRIHAALRHVRPGRLRLALHGLLRPFDLHAEPLHEPDPATLAESLSVSASTPFVYPSRFEVQELGLELAVFDQQSGGVHLLNYLASEIWRKSLLESGSEDVVKHLQTLYPDVALDRLRHDVLTTLDDLRSLGLLPHTRT